MGRGICGILLDTNTKEGQSCQDSLAPELAYKHDFGQSSFSHHGIATRIPASWSNAAVSFGGQHPARTAPSGPAILGIQPAFAQFALSAGTQTFLPVTHTQHEVDIFDVL